MLVSTACQPACVAALSCTCFRSTSNVLSTCGVSAQPVSAGLVGLALPGAVADAIRAELTRLLTDRDALLQRLTEAGQVAAQAACQAADAARRDEAR